LLLPGGNKAAVPGWMKTRSVLNWDRNATTTMDIWRLLRHRIGHPRLSEGTEDQEAEIPSGLSLSAVTALTDLIENVRAANSLSVFIGPYDQDPAGGVGKPEYLTCDYLSLINWDASDGHAMPWPSEAAVWASLGADRAKLITTLQARVQRATNNPTDLDHTLALLAKRWQKIAHAYNDGMETRGWRLLLVSTNLDAGLETALGMAGVSFFRILPTRRKLGTRRIERWLPGQGPQQVSEGAVGDPRQSLRDLTLGAINETAGRGKEIDVVLVRLGGVFGDPDSLTISTTDFFRNRQFIRDLPLDLSSALRADPLLIIGSALSSPLAQLVRAELFDTPESRTSLWVAPENPDDRLERLEDWFLDTEDGRDKCKRAFGVTTIVRALQYAFVSHLADQL
jgi:hypothetical protein